MEIGRIVGIALLATMLIVLTRQFKSAETGVLIALGVGAAIFLFLVDKIVQVIDIVEELAARADINRFYLSTVLKVIGIAYITEFGAQICRDAGESAVASKVELAGKVLIMILAIP
ncbi:MAG: stage III sporulation protein AD, partial [Clostridia bacterium]|nr:stage III sporulation protein AD [Clostridia bacterium]